MIALKLIRSGRKINKLYIISRKLGVRKFGNSNDINVQWSRTIGSKGNQSKTIPQTPEHIDQINVSSGAVIDCINVFYNGTVSTDKAGGNGGDKHVFKLDPTAAITQIDTYVGNRESGTWNGYIKGLKFTTCDHKTSPLYGVTKNATLESLQLPGPLVQMKVGTSTASGQKNVTIGSLSFGFIDWDITNIIYHVDSATHKQTSTNMQLTNVYVINKSSSEQSTTVTLSKEMNQTSSLTQSGGIALTVGTEVEAGIPMFVDGKVSISTTVNYNVEVGESKTVTQSYSISPTVNVSPNKAVKVSLIADEGQFTIPYTAEVSTILSHDGESQGTYTATSCYNFNVSYQDINISQIPKNSQVITI